MEAIVMTNGMDPDKMAPAQRVDEASMLLAMGMLRMLRRRRERGFSTDSGRDCLDVSLETRLTVTAGKP